MTDMTRIPEGYPYLRIAKQYNQNYSHVLEYADWITRARATPRTDMLRNTLPYMVRRGVMDAAATFMRIRKGQIDWQTGETL
jgi:hypothetical protein